MARKERLPQRSSEYDQIFIRLQIKEIKRERETKILVNPTQVKDEIREFGQ